jgi:transposase
MSNETLTTIIGRLGIDVSKAYLDVLLLYKERREGQRFTNTPEGYEKLHKWLSRRLQPNEVHICLEATGRYSEAAAETLLKLGYTVSVINPGRIKKFGESQLQRNKTDKLDAALIAEYCQRMQPPPWQPPSAEVRELQFLVRHLEDLKLMRKQVSNRLEAIPAEVSVADHFHQQLAMLNQQIEDTKHAIADHLKQYPNLKQQTELLKTIPGIGLQTIAKLIAECRDLGAFRAPGQLVAFAGLNPQQYQSGTSVVKQTTISRVGSASLRAALYMPAVSALQHNPVIRAFGERLRKRGVRGKAVIVAAMRKLLHLVAGVLKLGRPFEPGYARSS